MQEILVTCSKCNNRFKGAESTPSLILRIEISCPNCSNPVKTPYGLVTPFSKALYYFGDEEQSISAKRKDLKAIVSVDNAHNSEDEEARLSEILNAYLIWITNFNPEHYNVHVPAHASVSILPPSNSGENIHSFLRKKLQGILEAENIEREIDKAVNASEPVQYNVLVKMLKKFKGQGIDAAFVINKILQILS